MGFLSGFTLGFIGGLADGDDPPGFISFSAEAKGILFGSFLGILGGLIGLPVGAIEGSKDIYEMPAQTTTQAPGFVQQLTGSTILPPGDPLTKYGHQIRLRAFAGVKYYKRSEDILGDGGSEDIKGNGFVINKGGNWLEGTAAYISSGSIAIKMKGRGGIVRIPFIFIYELQTRKSNDIAWSPIWADDELSLSRDLGLAK